MILVTSNEFNKTEVNVKFEMNFSWVITLILLSSGCVGTGVSNTKKASTPSNVSTQYQFTGLTQASVSNTTSSDLPTVGHWTGAKGEVIPLKAIITVVQGDGNILIPRGDNFISSDRVNLDSRYGFLRNLTGRSVTANGGLEQPDVSLVNVPQDYSIKWVVDMEYLVIGYALVRNGTSAPFPLYNSRQEAQDVINAAKSARGSSKVGNSKAQFQGLNLKAAKTDNVDIPTIGNWVAGNQVISLKLVLTIVQGDGDIVFPRGDNFLHSSLVTLNPEYQLLKELTGRAITGMGGLEQPDLSLVNVPPGYTVRWIVDENYLVIGYGLARNGASLSITTYNSRADAQKRIDDLKSGGGNGNGGGNGGTTTGTNTSGNGGNVTKELSYSGGNGDVNYKYYFHSNGQPVPEQPKSIGNGYITVQIPSHAVIAKDVNAIPSDARPQIEYSIFDSAGNEVVYLKDTVTGYHPAFFSNPSQNASVRAALAGWVSRFNSFGPFGSPEDRGNNHKGELFQFFLKEGVYRWVYKNIGNTPNNIRAGFVRVGDDFYETVNPGDTVTKELHLFKYRGKPGEEEYDMYKLNTNYY